MAILSSRPFTFDRVVRLIIGLGIAAALLWLIHYLRNELLPFAVACLIAYLLEPVLEFNQKLLHLKGRVIVTFVTLFEVLFLFSVIGYFTIPSIIDELSQMSLLVKRYYESSAELPLIPEEVHVFLRRYINPELQKMLSIDHLEAIWSKGTSIISESIDIIIRFVEWFLMFIYVIFIMIDYPYLARGFRKMVPPKFRDITYKVFHDIKLSMDRYFRGQSVLALCAAVFYSIGFSIVGIPLSIVLGITVGVLYLIPYFQYITLVPVTIVCIVYSMGGDVHFWTIWSECLIVYVVSQSTCDYILTPKIMGKVMGLNPAIILLSLSIWGALLGIIGMLIALPMTTLIIAYYNEYVLNEPSGLLPDNTTNKQPETPQPPEK